MQLTDEKGKVIKTYEYDSFENEVKPDSKDENQFRYCGEYYDTRKYMASILLLLIPELKNLSYVMLG